MTYKEKLEQKVDMWEAKLEELDPGSKEFTAVAAQLNKTRDQLLDIEKFDSEQDIKVQIANAENELKSKQSNDENKSRWGGIVAQLAGVLISVGVSAGLNYWGTKYTVNFEEHGTTTTTAGRNHLNNLFRKK